MQRSVRSVPVVMLDVLAQYDVEVAWSGDRRWSRHSRRRVPMKRSAIAFARGARIGVRMTRFVGTYEDGVERGGELAVPVADQEPELVGVFAEVHEKVAGLL